MPDESGRQAGAEVAASVCFAASTLAAIALAVVYWRGGNTQAEGTLLAVVTGGIGVGIVAVGEAGDAARRGHRTPVERGVDGGGGRSLRR